MRPLFTASFPALIAAFFAGCSRSALSVTRVTLRFFCPGIQSLAYPTCAFFLARAGDSSS